MSADLEAFMRRMHTEYTQLVGRLTDDLMSGDPKPTREAATERARQIVRDALIAGDWEF